MKRHEQLSIFVLICINAMDALLGAVLGPTFIFYVNELGGTTSQYGMILSAGSVAAMIMIPVYGKWVDTNGNKYRKPYMVTFIIGIVANLIYFAACLFPKGYIAIYVLGLSRFLAGASGAGRTLSYTWVASSILPNEQRNIYTVLSLCRTFGSIVGPLTNILVSDIDKEFQIFGLTVPVDPNNSIGLLMVGGEIFLVVIMLLFLQEPPDKKVNKKGKSEESSTKTESKGILYALSHFNIFFPIFTMFVIMCSFQLLGVAFSPIARNMGYNPVEISEVFAVGSAVLAIGMVLSMVVSMSNVSDTVMVSFGIGNFFISCLLMYMFWTEGAGYWQFTLPMYLMFFGYPFIGPANRSSYTKAIISNKELEGSQGVMMGLMNQAAMFAGLIAPTFIAAFVIRDQAEIDTSLNKHELTAGALFAPILSFILLACLLWHFFFTDLPTKRESNNDTDAISENTMLVSGAAKNSSRSSLIAINDRFSVSSEAYRRMSVEIMGVPNPVETKYEMELNKQLLIDKELWDEIEKLDDIED